MLLAKKNPAIDARCDIGEALGFPPSQEVDASTTALH